MRVNICTILYVSIIKFMYFFDFVFSSLKHSGLGPRHRFHFYVNNFILLFSVTTGNTHLADISCCSPRSFGKRIGQISKFISIVKKQLLKLISVEGESVSSSQRRDHTSVIWCFHHYQPIVWFKLCFMGCWTIMLYYLSVVKIHTEIILIKGWKWQFGVYEYT